MLNIMLKAKYSFISALLFFIVSNPELYKLTQWLFGSFIQIAHPMGAPTPFGIVLHSIVFFAGMFILMTVPATY
jgi:hypothetical protein